MSQSSQNLQDLDDEALVQRCQAELPLITAAFEEIVRRYEPVIYGTCRKILGNDQDAQEAVQDIFVRLSNKIGLFEGRSKFNTWLYKLVHHVAIRRRQQLVGRQRRAEDYAETVRERQTAPGANEPDGGFVMDVLESMEEGEREILMLKFASELEFQQISEVLGIGLSAAKMRYYRALEHFKERVAEIRQNSPN